MQARKITLIEIGAGALPVITPAAPRQSSWFPIVYVSPDTPQVEGVVPNPVADGVLIEWDAVDQEGVIYIIERGPTQDGPWTEIARVVETRYLYSDGSGQEWWFKITASVRGKPGQGSIVVATPPPTVQEILDLFAEQTKLAADMAAGFAAQAVQIASLESALSAADYDPTVGYAPGAVVKWEGGLYYALVETLGNVPSNATYWRKIGEYDSLAEAVGAQAVLIATQQTRLEQTEDALEVVAEQAGAVAAALPGKADASAVDALASRVVDAEDKAEANAQAIQAANAAIAGKASSAGLNALSSTVTQQGQDISANSLALTAVRSTVGGQVNLLSNSSIEATLRDWSISWDSGSTGATLVRNRYGFNFPYGDANLSINIPPNTPAGQYVAVRNGRMIPAAPGDTFWVQQIYNFATGVAVTMGVEWVNSSGAVVSSQNWDLPVSGTGWPLYSRIATAPAGAVGFHYWVRSYTIASAAAERLVWIARPMVSRSIGDQLAAPPYVPSSVGIDAKYAAATQALEARTTINENGLASYFASWTMSLDANGRVAGIRSVNNGATSTIDFLFDKVRFVSPGSGRRMEYSDGHFLGYDENNVRRIRLGTWSA